MGPTRRSGPSVCDASRETKPDIPQRDYVFETYTRTREINDQTKADELTREIIRALRRGMVQPGDRLCIATDNHITPGTRAILLSAFSEKGWKLSIRNTPGSGFTIALAKS